MLTGVGGGMARDVLLAEIPTVLRSDFMLSRHWSARRLW
jgi:uncharacterized membrane protein YeiH